MTVRTHRVPLADPLRAIDVRNPAGSVTVRADEGADELVVTIEPLDDVAEQLADRVDVTATRSHLRVAVPERRLQRAPSFAVVISTPPGAAVRAAVATADMTLRGRLGPATLTSASGDVAVEHCTELQVRSASGDIRAGVVEGAATLASASGDVRLGSAGGPALLRTASGVVVVDEVTGDLSVRTASGDLRVGRASRGTVRLTTVSGDATVGVEPGLRLWLDLRSVSGRLDSDLAEEGAEGGSPDLTVVLQSVSGDLRIRRALPRAVVPHGG
jgi:putative adhesin